MIGEVIQAEQLDASVSLSMEEIYRAFLESKLDVKNGLVPIGEIESFSRETAAPNGRDDAETTELGIAAYYEDNASQAVEYLRAAAENGYAEAQNWLGLCYEGGEGVAEDIHEAFKWYMKAAQQDDPSAQNSVGYCYDYGRGVAENKSEAFKWYMKSAEQDFPLPTAQCRVGICYDYGRGVAENKSEAFKWYMKAAQQGHAHAQFCVGYCYDNGESVAPSVSTGFGLFPFQNFGERIFQ